MGVLPDNTQNPLIRVNALRKTAPLQQVEAGCGSLGYRVERAGGLAFIL
jgi:hypothetical protein